MSIRGLAIGLVLLCPVAGRADENGKAKAAW